MSIKNLYVSEKEMKHQSKMVVLQGDDIYFKEVKGNRKNLFESKWKNTFTLDEIERKMRYNDICKQYELFFNIKLKHYTNDYLEQITKLLALNEKDYLQKRKELNETRKKKFSPLKTTNNFLKHKKENEKLEVKKMNHTVSNFHNPKTETNINTNINTNENTENTQFEQGKFLIVDSDLPEPKFRNYNNLTKKSNTNDPKEMRFFVNKITKKRGSLLNIKNGEEENEEQYNVNNFIDNVDIDDETGNKNNINIMHRNDSKSDNIYNHTNINFRNNAFINDENKKKNDINTFNKTHQCFSNDIPNVFKNQFSFFEPEEIRRFYFERNNNNRIPIFNKKRPSSLRKVIPNSFIGDYLKCHKLLW